MICQEFCPLPLPIELQTSCPDNLHFPPKKTQSLTSLSSGPKCGYRVHQRQPDGTFVPNKGIYNCWHNVSDQVCCLFPGAHLETGRPEGNPRGYFKALPELSSSQVKGCSCLVCQTARTLTYGVPLFTPMDRQSNLLKSQ
jgi:hypothetical protein